METVALTILVLFGSDATRLQRSLVWNKAALRYNFTVIYATAECSGTVRRMIQPPMLLACLPCCVAGPTTPAREWRHNNRMTKRLHWAFKRVLQQPFNNLLKIDDDTFVRYDALNGRLKSVLQDPKASSGLTAYGQCEYAAWEQMTFCGGGSGLLLSRRLVQMFVSSVIPVGAEDVELSRSIVKAGGRLVHVNGFSPFCHRLDAIAITRHHCTQTPANEILPYISSAHLKFSRKSERVRYDRYSKPTE